MEQLTPLTKEQETIVLSMNTMIAKMYNKFFAKVDAGTHLKEDFLSAGLLAVMEHIRDYSPEKGKATTFFRPYIMKEMREICTKDIFHSTEYLLKTGKKIKKKYNSENITDSIADIGKAIGSKADTVQHALTRMNIRDISINDNDLACDTIKELHYQSTPESVFLDKEYQLSNIQICDELIDAQSETDKAFFIDRWGLHNQKALNIKDLAEKYHMSAEEAVCAHRRCLRRATKKCHSDNITSVF